MSLRDLPRSTRKVFVNMLKSDKPLRLTDLRKQVDMADRTINFGLRRLQTQKLVKKMPDLMDMRRPLYFVPTEVRNRFKLLKSR